MLFKLKKIFKFVGGFFQVKFNFQEKIKFILLKLKIKERQLKKIKICNLNGSIKKNLKKN